MTVKEVLLLGNPILYEISEPVEKQALTHIAGVVKDLHDTMMAFRERYGVGRAIAAPQIGIMKRLVYMHIHEPVIFINPLLDNKSEDMIQVWDDCMCFPELLVKVRRHKSCRIRYQNMDWGEEQMWLEDDLSELLQHEIDHLDGILALSRAMDNHSFALRSQRPLLDGRNAFSP